MQISFATDSNSTNNIDAISQVCPKLVLRVEALLQKHGRVIRHRANFIAAHLQAVMWMCQFLLPL